MSRHFNQFGHSAYARTSPDPVPTSTEEDSNNLVQSIDDIQTPQQVSNFELVPIAFGDQSVVDLIIGTKEKDKILDQLPAKYSRWSR